MCRLYGTTCFFKNQIAVHYCHQDHFTITEPLLFETYTVLILSLALSFQLHSRVYSIAGASWLHSAVSFLRICNRVLSYCNIHSLKEWLCQGCLEKSVDMRIWYFLTQKKGTKALMSAMLLLSLKTPTYVTFNLLKVCSICNCKSTRLEGTWIYIFSIN